MTLDEIKSALKANGDVPVEALASAPAHADELAPGIYEVAGKLGRGVYLLPAEANLLLYGLNVLAAARHGELLDSVLALARLPTQTLEQVFGHHTPVCLQRLLISVWDREPTDLFKLIEHGDFESEARWALYNVLARLTFDGRIGRGEAKEFLARIERDGLMDDDDTAWWGWAEAVERIGLTELEPALLRVFEKPIFENHTSAEREEMLEALRAAAANPTDPSEFDADDIRPITDPVEAVAWIERRTTALAQWETAQGTGLEVDAAKDRRLTGEELEWLDGFLASSQAPPTTMSFETLDGFLTALVVGPEVVPVSEYLPVIWGTDDGSGPSWDSTEQAEYFFKLLIKHWNAIVARRIADAVHVPYIEHFGVSFPGEQWADGFMVGVDLRADAWQPVFDDSKAEETILAIADLAPPHPDDDRKALSPKQRQAVLKRLPALVQALAAYWLHPGRGFPRQEPARSEKVGRNEPCPCGSGKKFKKCCGTTPASTTH